MNFTKIDTIAAIDVGVGGAISHWRNDGNISVVNMPKDLKALNGYIAYLKSISENPIVFIEHVQMRPQDAVGGKQFGIVKMLKNYHQIETIVKTNHLPLIPVLPRTWQSRLKIYVRGEDYQVRKKRLKQIAASDYPQIKVTIKNCDALLILKFARFMLQNDPNWVTERFPEDFELF